MAFCFDESFEGGIFPCNPYKNVHKFGQILNVLKICIHGMQKLPEVSHLTAVKVLSAVVVVCVQSAFLFLSWVQQLSVNGLYYDQAPENLYSEGK